MYINYIKGNNIGNDGVYYLSDNLQYTPNLESLYLYRNNIENEGAECLSQSFKYIPHLKNLSLSRIF